jgi:hypothetical protein
LERKFGRGNTESFFREYNISGNIEALTDGEGRFFGSQPSLDSIRTAIDEGSLQGSEQNNGGAIQGSGVTALPDLPTKPSIVFTDQNTTSIPLKKNPDRKN